MTVPPPSASYGRVPLPFTSFHLPYESRRKIDVWPQGKRLALLVYAAPEQWMWDVREPFQTSLVRATPNEPLPTLSSRSAIDYGFRVGLPRMLDIFDEHSVSATMLTNATSAVQYPELIRETAARGHEIEAHGLSQGRPLSILSDEEQASDIAQAVADLERIVGVRPTGWLGPGALATAGSVVRIAEAGLSWHGDLQDDDLPYFIDSGDHTLVEIPYRMIGNVNDVLFSGVQKSPAEARAHLWDAFEAARRQAARTPMHFIYGTHPHVSGRPEWAQLLGDFLAYAQSLDDVWITTYRAVADWWRQEFGARRDELFVVT